MARGKAVVAAEARAAVAGAVVKAEVAVEVAAAANETVHAPQVVCHLSITDHQLPLTNKGDLEGGNENIWCDVRI